MTTLTARPRLNPRKLLHSKWTAVLPERREKHFIVIECVEPEEAGGVIESIVLEAVHSRRIRVLPWRQLQDPTVWMQGWK
jgi:tryptophan-rich hypothetical protein